MSGITNALSGITSIWGGLQQINQGNSLMRQGQGYLNDAMNIAQSGYNQALKIYQNRQASGAYNAANALDLARRQAAHDLNLQNMNSAAKLANIGYKRGDSVIDQTMKHNVTDANYNLTNKLINTQGEYDQRALSDLGMVSNANNYLNQVLTNSSADNIQRGNLLKQSTPNLIGSILSTGLEGGWDSLKF